tara:strand:+ start:2582 stop:4210 length:1629 start_codon:yes stop_codon:yes gene_type:complete
VTEDSMTFDVLIVGAGPAGLAAGINIQQLAEQHNQTIRVCIIEKGAQIGAHILSGAVIEPRSLKELLPDSWQEAPFDISATEDSFHFLTAKRAFKLPTPKFMHNTGNYLVSLGKLCQFLAQKAEALGCEIYTGFAANAIVYDDNKQVIGIKTNSVGLDKHGQPTERFQPGIQLLAKQTLFAEGCRGQLSLELMRQFNLYNPHSPQTYAIGLKEVWRVKPSALYKPGKVIHTIGWPVDNQTYGGSFVYHLSNQHVALGFVVGLDYQNPYLSPFDELQRFKTHPFIRPLLHEGERISYGARALCEGGWQALPKLTFPGGALIGDAAGFLNVPKIKGIHTAIQSGMLAAQACFNELKAPSNNREIIEYTALFKKSWLAQELYQVRNIRPGFKAGLRLGLLHAAFEAYISHGHMPWTLTHHQDHTELTKAQASHKIVYPKPDNTLTFDKLSSVYLTNTYHEENQPNHLHLKKPELAISYNYQYYGSPETHYCPAGVYEIVDDAGKPRLQINAQNCIHCKTCDIKDPKQNIIWTAPEGGGGPNYIDM